MPGDDSVVTHTADLDPEDPNFVLVDLRPNSPAVQ